MSDDLAKAFEAERRRREGAVTPSLPESEVFGGIREIVLDDDGRPQAIPRRPAPAPDNFAAEGLASLPSNPQFLLGVLVFVGGLALLLAIGQADMEASM